MELNAEQIKKQMQDWSDAICENACLKGECLNGIIVTCENCMPNTVRNALALINSQEQRIEALTVELDAMRGAANSYKMHNEELTEENERLNTAIPLWAKQCVELEERLMQLRADTIREMQERLKAYFGTYVLGYKIPLSEALKAVNQIAKEIEQGK